MSAPAPDPAPLRDVLVVELGTSVAVPFGTQILADLGATVVKVERPGAGDDARHWGPPFWEGTSAAFQALNRSKRSVTVNLRDAEERAELRRYIVERADVVLQNLRPGLVEELGLGAALLEESPRLVYCNLGAFGAAGPLRERPGYDPLMQAFGGIMSVTGLEGMPPVRVGTSIIDLASGMWAAIGILAALRERERTGRGGRVDASLFETALAWMTIPIASYLASGEVPRKHGSSLPMLCPYRVFEAQDGPLMIAVGTDAHFRRFCEALGRAEWAEDERFATNPARVASRELLEGRLEELLRSRPREHWAGKLDAAGVPCAVLQTTDQVVAHAQTQALGMLQPTPEGKLRLVGLPLSFDGRRPAPRRAAPELGEYDAELWPGRAASRAASREGSRR